MWSTWTFNVVVVTYASGQSPVAPGHPGRNVRPSVNGQKGTLVSEGDK